MNSEQIKELLPKRSFKDIQDHFRLFGKDVDDESSHDYFEIVVFYIGYLCARGEIEKIKKTIDEAADKEFLLEILNYPLYEFHGGTVLHMALKYNKSFELFELLWNNGAKDHKDSYDELPWEQKDQRWVLPITDEDYEKDNEEFVDFYKEIKDIVESEQATG
jgi:hypothetical protein